MAEVVWHKLLLFPLAKIDIYDNVIVVGTKGCKEEIQWEWKYHMHHWKPKVINWKVQNSIPGIELAKLNALTQNAYNEMIEWPHSLL